MNILFVGEAVSGFGGIETVLKKVTSFLENDGETENTYTLYFLCRDDRMDKTWLAGKQFVCHRSRIKISFLRRMSHACALTRFIKQNQHGAVIAFDAPSCRIAAQAIRYSKKILPLISWLHYSLDHKKHAEQVLVADHHLAISSGIKQQLMKRGVPSERISVVFNPVTPQSITIPRPVDKAVFLYVGRLKFEGQKRLKDMLDAFVGLEGNWECHFIGDGSDARKCQSYAQQLGINERIHWHGWQVEPWIYIQQHIPAVSTLLLTSSFEGFGMVLAEAMSYGIYCVSSDCISGPRDIIKNDINGKLFKVMDSVHLNFLLKEIIIRKIDISSEEIKKSIAFLYEEKYYLKLKKILEEIIDEKTLKASL
ncbi:lipopolysaccharide 1,6-galactosyltransferase [Pectobacterium brasiliense]|uniref:lipopolysaccharide 1,6-galactosyltransferase n=1 Tax=Pectobacterium brasiliense TaxID=180957 RepID=UPI0032EE6CE6